MLCPHCNSAGCEEDCIDFCGDSCKKEYYGTEKSKHLGICIDCKEDKIVRWHLTTAQKEVEVCDECYMKS